MKTSVILASVTTLGLLGFQSAWAQNAQTWLTNEENKIQQDAGSGMINSQQAGNLQNRAAQIQQQEQTYLNQNGGTLTPQEGRQIGHEVRGLNRGLSRDVRRDNPAFGNGWLPPGTPTGTAAPYYPYAQYAPNPYAQPNPYQLNQANWTPAERQAWEQQHPHHHHHQGQWNNGQGYFNPNWSGTTNGGNPQYWNH
jgi:hypothetical protein